MPYEFSAPARPRHRARNRLLVSLSILSAFLLGGQAGFLAGAPSLADGPPSVEASTQSRKDAKSSPSSASLRPCVEDESQTELPASRPLLSVRSKPRQPTAARERLAQGCELLATGDVEAACAAFRAGLDPELDWNSPTGIALRQRLREAEALSRGARVGRIPLGLRPRKSPERTLAAEAHYERGMARLKIGEFVPGVLDMARALELDAKRAEELINRTTRSSGCHVRIERVLAELNTLVANRPLDSAPLLLRALYIHMWACCRQASRTRAELELALADLKAVLLLCPDHATAPLFQARLEAELQR